MKKVFSLLFVIVVISLFIASCEGGDTNMIDAKAVREIPQGFISLKKYEEMGLRWMPFETQITFLDAEDIGIYSTGFDNSDFIVKYNGEYYVYEKKLSEIIEVATIAPEQRRKTYSLNEPVYIRGASKTVYTVKIKAVEAGEAVEDENKSYKLIPYQIRYVVSSNAPDDELTNNNFICLVETKDGATGNIFDYIDAGSERIVSFSIREDKKLGSIILISPEYPGLTYRVVVDE